MRDMSRAGRTPIRDIRFSDRRARNLGIEIIPLEALFARGLERVLEAPHRVHFYHIMLFARGTGSHVIDFESHAFDARTLLLVSKGQVNQFRVNRAAGGRLIVFTSEFLVENATPRTLSRSLQVFEQALYAPALRLAPEERKRLEILVEELACEAAKPDDELSSEILRHLLRLVLLQIERLQRAGPAGGRVPLVHREFCEFRRLVERDLAASRSVGHYARLLSVSPRKLNEWTRRALNRSAKEFIQDQVVLEARRLLAEGEMPIKEIAYHLGFSEPTNFVKFFRKHARTSPVAFRRRFVSSR